MYLIALCDDEVEQLHKTERIFAEYRNSHSGEDFRVESFESAEKLLALIERQEYLPDLIIMDIYMPDKLGIEAVRELRRMGNRSQVVFLTTSREFALDAYEVEAAQYLVKPLSGEKLFLLLDRFLKEMEEERRKYILLRIENTLQRIAVDDIVYCEAQGKVQCMHFANGTQCILRITMAKIVEMLSPYSAFMRVGIAYLVNMEHVEYLNKAEIQMVTGKKIYLPRGAFQAVREKYFAYYCGEFSFTKQRVD